MPELPEVETIANDLQKRVVDQKILQVKIFLPKIIKGSAKQFVDTLQKNHFTNVRRRAKFLIFTLASGQLMLVHLRMTGQLIYQKRDSNVKDKNKESVVAGGHGEKKDLENLPGKHTHLMITFIDGSQLFYNDLRRFGFLQIIKPENLNQELRNFGQEPLTNDFTLEMFHAMLADRKGKIKTFLLNQKYLVGLGNIYTDEVLFDARVLPDRIIHSLSEQELKKIYLAIKNVLHDAVLHRGTTFNDYRDANGRKGNFLSKLKVYSRSGEKCLRCRQGMIQKKKMAGRGTSYCEHCQV